MRYRELRSDQIEVGKTYLYKNKRVGDREGEISNTIHPLAIYDATVIGIYPHHIVANLLVHQDTIRGDMCFGPAKPYNWSIEKVELGRFDHLYEEVLEDDTTDS